MPDPLQEAGMTPQEFEEVRRRLQMGVPADEALADLRRQSGAGAYSPTSEQEFRRESFAPLQQQQSPYVKFKQPFAPAAPVDDTPAWQYRGNDPQQLARLLGQRSQRYGLSQEDLDQAARHGVRFEDIQRATPQQPSAPDDMTEEQREAVVQQIRTNLAGSTLSQADRIAAQRSMQAISEVNRRQQEGRMTPRDAERARAQLQRPIQTMQIRQSQLPMYERQLRVIEATRDMDFQEELRTRQREHWGRSGTAGMFRIPDPENRGQMLPGFYQHDLRGQPILVPGTDRGMREPITAPMILRLQDQMRDEVNREFDTRQRNMDEENNRFMIRARQDPAFFEELTQAPQVNGTWMYPENFTRVRTNEELRRLQELSGQRSGSSQPQQGGQQSRTTAGQQSQPAGGARSQTIQGRAPVQRSQLPVEQQLEQARQRAGLPPVPTAPMPRQVPRLLMD